MPAYALLGWIAWWTLFATLMIRPLADLTGLKILKRMLVQRKWIGDAMFLIGCFHVTLILSAYMLNLSVFWNPQYWDFRLNWPWGMLAMITLTPLFITSNKFSIRLLKRNWKRLHLIVYGAFIFAGIHIYIFSREPLLTLLPMGIWMTAWVWARRLRRKQNS
jgi:sulfoxide reductase heme-binding subunit YedZ